MYIWGGGWDAAKMGNARRIGMDKDWGDFAKQQTSDYDFEEYLEENELGLDCSGYVAWVLYNLFEKKDGEEGYLTVSTGMARALAERGMGRLIKNPKEFMPGDIVSMQGHVWISLGTCQDDSVLLVHSSPPGVSVCGTQTEGEDKSIAVQLAEKYMIEHHLSWQEKYPKRSVPSTYLEDVYVFRWSTNVLSDAKKYQLYSGEEMIPFL